MSWEKFRKLFGEIPLAAPEDNGDHSPYLLIQGL
jgi:hypothetical protein